MSGLDAVCSDGLNSLENLASNWFDEDSVGLNDPARRGTVNAAINPDFDRTDFSDEQHHIANILRSMMVRPPLDFGMEDDHLTELARGHNIRNPFMELGGVMTVTALGFKSGILASGSDESGYHDLVVEPFIKRSFGFLNTLDYNEDKRKRALYIISIEGDNAGENGAYMARLRLTREIFSSNGKAYYDLGVKVSLKNISSNDMVYEGERHSFICPRGASPDYVADNLYDIARSYHNICSFARNVSRDPKSSARTISEGINVEADGIFAKDGEREVFLPWDYGDKSPDDSVFAKAVYHESHNGHVDPQTWQVPTLVSALRVRNMLGRTQAESSHK